MHSLALGPLQITDETANLLAKRMRQVAYVLLVLSMIILFRWIKIPRAHIPLFDVASEVNFWTWLNVSYMLFAAYMMGLSALVRRYSGAPFWGWVLAGAAVLFLSLDDFISIHERFGALGQALGGGSGLLHFAWVIPGIIAAAGLVLIFWTAMRSAAPVVRRDFALGLALFFGGAVGLEMVSGWVLSNFGHRRPYTLLYHLEEMCEAAGIILIGRAALKDLIRGASGAPPAP
ncbi:Multidrug resistance protein (Efflux pump/antiporter) [Sulfitobacter noctilucae]|uniref:hypothetical protein n=1 Tax=Sulfitobacter noctilucae TaxID=1342302 RepID=UPI00046A404A|nr:hypothetical protein [Sulfitobacter noctilucae]KIN70906.1 Multidrug resistance protein (Efflux pump/antiporter) [Sulfitobacter noctilucae]